MVGVGNEDYKDRPKAMWKRWDLRRRKVAEENRGKDVSCCSEKLYPLARESGHDPIAKINGFESKNIPKLQTCYFKRNASPSE